MNPANLASILSKTVPLAALTATTALKRLFVVEDAMWPPSKGTGVQLLSVYREMFSLRSMPAPPDTVPEMLCLLQAAPNSLLLPSPVTYKPIPEN